MYFFIDPANLTSQTASDAYGPLSTDLTNIYNTTSRFQLTVEAKAFACQEGNMIVQESTEDASLVNIIIEPTNNLKVGIEVEYYIYRGILKNSLINETACEIQVLNSTSNDLIKRMRQDTYVTDNNCRVLGYDNSLVDSNLLDNLFHSRATQPLPCVYVKEGEWIGTFTKDYKIGFEIVLKSDFNNLNLGFLRAPNNQINVTSLTGFEQRVKREEILKFIDPAAFFGMHYSDTVNYYVNGATNNTETTTKNSRLIYTKLLDKFFTKNKVYIDIRSEKGYSYNFYQNYKVSNTDLNNIQIRPEPGTGALSSQEYLTNSWPILIIESTHTSGSTNKLRLKLRVGDNTKPILYTKTELKKSLANTNNKDIEPNYIKTKKLIENGSNPDHTDWTNEFRIFFPNTSASGDRNYISNYVRLHYFRTKYNANNTNTSVLENIHYYDSAFCSIDIIKFDDALGNLDIGDVESANPIYVREPLHLDSDHTDYDENYNLEGTGNFELNMVNGAYWGSGKVLMYAKIAENPVETSEKEYLNTYDQELSSFTQNIKYKSFREDLKIICREYDITGNTNNTKILGINFFNSNLEKNYKENLMLLGLTIDEMMSIKADMQLSNGHHRFIHLEPLADNPQQDNNTPNSNRYFAYRVRLQGFDNNQSSSIVTPQHSGNDIIVYSRDNQFFSSYEFSKDETVTSGENRVEFHIYNDGVIKINDNIDLALIREENTSGNNITRIYYKYYNASSTSQSIPNTDITDVCNLGFRMANKLETGVIYYSSKHGELNTFSLNHINHHQEAINAGVANVNAHDSWENIEGDVMTYGDIMKNGHRRRYYKNKHKKTFFVHFDRATVIASPLTIALIYDETLRYYAKPDLAAATIGVLIKLGNTGFTSTGFSYRNSSCYPSVSHVNGEAIDVKYSGNYLNTGASQPTEIANDVNVIRWLYKFGFRKMIIGNNDYHNSIYDGLPTANRVDMIENRNDDHDNHIHSYHFEIRKTPITYENNN